MTEESLRQYTNEQPARLGKIICLGFDATSRAYDLTALSLGSVYQPGQAAYVYLTLEPEGATLAYAFNSATGTIDASLSIAAGTALSFPAGHCRRIKDGDFRRIRICRNVDKFMILQAASGSGIVRISASSHASAGAAQG